jgi:chemotaxis signal transduction protein
MDRSTIASPSSNADPINQRFILTQLGEMTLVFPSQLVAETLLVERTQILPLPFYESVILGCVHSGGQIVPLVDVQAIVGARVSAVRDVLTVVRLSEQAGNLAGIGLIVTQLLGSRTRDNLPQELFEEGVADSTYMAAGMHLFRLTLLSKQLFQPQRWIPAG